jgi:hypothetical protein
VLANGEFERAALLAEQAVALAHRDDDEQLIGAAPMILDRAQADGGPTPLQPRWCHRVEAA